MAAHTYICLFDLPAYDKRVAPALREYQNRFNPSAVVALLRDIAGELQALRKDPDRQVPDSDDCQHWIDAIAPDAGYKPSADTVKELASMLIQNLCVVYMQEIGRFVPYLTERSEWFADLMDGGEELAGGRLEFTFGSGALIATRQQIRQFLDEVNRVPPPEGNLAADYANLKRLLAEADANRNYTVLKTDVAP
ncbi:MAG: hypothetical protein KGN84_23195, partial [Acidobacteriota bacterium]|nr:hypothetical protein [Acidobacteriota bacterium]